MSLSYVRSATAEKKKIKFLYAQAAQVYQVALLRRTWLERLL
jgi:hypothetical protein